MAHLPRLAGARPPRQTKPLLAATAAVPTLESTDQALLSAGERTRATTDTPNASKPSYKLRDNFVWSDLGPEKISDVTPYELVEWLIGHGITLKFKPVFFPKAQTPRPWEVLSTTP